jgi:hypothetical protein
MSSKGKGAQKKEIATPRIDPLILTVRSQKVIIDEDLARIYGVETRRLNEQVKRNADRFPEDFVFRLTKEEHEYLRQATDLKSQIAISSYGHGGRRKAPYAFTEHGAIMAANVLKTSRAIRMSVFVVRAFVRLREMAATHRELAKKLAELEQRLEDHDEKIEAIFEAIRQLMAPPEKERNKIGFEVKEGHAHYGDAHV